MPNNPKLLLAMMFHHNNNNPKTEVGTGIVRFCCDRLDHVFWGSLWKDFGTWAKKTSVSLVSCWKKLEN